MMVNSGDWNFKLKLLFHPIKIRLQEYHEAVTLGEIEKSGVA